MIYDINNAKTDLKPMTVLFRAHVTLAKLAKEDVKNYNLNVSEFSVLELLHHKGELATSIICEKVLMPNSSMSYIIEKLVSKKLVTRTQDLNDKRTFYVSLSSYGKAITEEILASHYNRLNTIFNVLNQQEKTTLVDLLKRVGFSAENAMVANK